MRVTAKYLIKLVNEEFKRLEINDCECYEVNRTHFSSYQYEGGACRLYIRFRIIEDHSTHGKFLCFFSMQEIQGYLDSGYELFLDFSKGRYNAFTLEEIELNVRKK